MSESFTCVARIGDRIELDDGGVLSVDEFVINPPSTLWVLGATEFVRWVKRETGVWLEDVREAQLLWRVLHPELHANVGGSGFPSRMRPSELRSHVLAAREQCDSAAWACLRNEQAVDALWRPVTHRGIRVDEAELRRAAEGIERERRQSVERWGVDLTTLDHRTEQFLARHAIHVPGGLSKERWAEAVMPASSQEAWEAFQQARTIAQDAGKVQELLEAAQEGRVHPNIPAMAAVTGRQQISGPAMQNLPARMRQVVLPDEGMVFVGCDLHAVEPHVAAWLSGDAAMAEHLASGDVYAELAARLNVDRAVAKTTLLATLYRQGVSSLAKRLCLAEDEARRVRAELLAAYPHLRQWMEWLREAPALRTGLGRPLPTPAADYVRTNYVVQGTAKDLLTHCVLNASRIDGIQLTLPVHDELLVQCLPQDAERVMQKLSVAMTLQLSDTITVHGEATIHGGRWSK